jgi:hypothetical protein
MKPANSEDGHGGGSFFPEKRRRPSGKKLNPNEKNSFRDVMI